MVSSRNILSPRHPAHVLRHGERCRQSQGGGNYRCKRHQTDSVYGKLPDVERTLQTEPSVTAQGTVLMPYVPARRTINRAIPPVGITRTRLAGFPRTRRTRTALCPVPWPLSPSHTTS